MPFPQITHHGAVNGVTGSCHELHADAANSYLIDCGLFQGADTANGGRAGQGSLDIEFPLNTVRALIATHVHIDHVGRIPYLLAAGFKGPILCSEPSAKLLPIVLEDAFKLGVSRDQKKVERYIKLIEQRIIALPYNTWFTLQGSSEIICRVRLQRAGHILGSAYVEFDLQYPKTGEKKRVVFSGDLGAPHAPLLPAPKPPHRVDILVIESTYGDHNHEDRRTRRQRLEKVIEQALLDKGTVLIPAFSIGRTQELLYELEEIIHTKPSRAAAPVGARSLAKKILRRVTDETNWPELPIILDSPLASRFTAAYRELQPFWNQEAIKRVQSGRRPLGFEQLITVDSHGDHLRMVQYLARTARPAIVIAGNGMCSSGRIVNYLKAMLGDSRHNVLFVGYQAAGTPGRAIQSYGPAGGYVDIDGERIDIKAGIDSIGGYSAHADHEGLVKFVTGMRQRPSHIRIVHGESKAKQALAARLAAIYQDKQQPLQLEIPQ
ncbi:MBL fold metallo-hydrolase RNA specificity domain-containing protein [Stutzerimonas xanthomarina]|uniref:Metallo-beta-lactamase family protein n=2 Tax=Stutzerimonas xanthomarina TaxID=271420 RepID=A0A1M5KP46_9GAMM|nr:MBL fold metallo-hydrolase [Stutzerimonas xanthomarina]MCP9337200.1 MBL fold metallo-hydrolase [Stutzerimonas xanthomarina]SEI07284.1 metallo-beta-lactamase family protein [Stutzerimonas xanthomarina]SHG53953.1 metallo-beta-lactamase family protein [Stutzerimonas xanthomarina DSM 18231]